MADIAFLSLFAFLAGLVDSVAGGGGLIQLPALLIFMPHVAVPTLLGTNKLASICGTSVATLQYARYIRIDWKATMPATLAAFVCSFLGARVTTLLKPEAMRPIVLILLVGVFAYTMIRKDFGSLHLPRLGDKKQLLVSLATGSVIGFYDGFFGPGTGSFLIFVFIGIFGFSFLAASASSKVVNFTTNLAAILYFVFTGNVLYAVALPMAFCNILGAVVGTRLAVLKGNRFVRVIFLVVVAGMILKIAYDTFRMFF